MRKASAAGTASGTRIATAKVWLVLDRQRHALDRNLMKAAGDNLWGYGDASDNDNFTSLPS
jgi:hypothetical protein